MREPRFALLLSFCLAFAPVATSAQSTPVSADLPTFDAATIKPPDPAARGRLMGFYGKPGGRIFFGGFLKMFIEIAFNLQDYQVLGAPTWINSQWFDVNAVPPDTSPSRNITVANAEPSPEQRLMLQSLLRDRFAFKYHLETKEGEVYFLTRGSKPLQLKPPKDPNSDPRAIVLIRSTGIDGDAVGNNTTTDYLAQRLSQYLQLPVLNQTGIAGSYDFNLKADDPGNQEVVSAVFSVVDRLGLKLKRGRGPVQTLVIDHIEQPSQN